MSTTKHGAEAIADLLEHELEVALFAVDADWRTRVPPMLVEEARTSIAAIGRALHKALTGIGPDPSTPVEELCAQLAFTTLFMRGEAPSDRQAP